MTVTNDVWARPRVSLDDKLALIQEIDSLEQMKKELEMTLRSLRDKLRESVPLGHVGTINGQPAWTQVAAEGRLATAEFRKKYPDIAAEFEEWVSEKKIDVARLQKERPDLFEEFQVRTLARVGAKA